jgi:hypothetical protein
MGRAFIQIRHPKTPRHDAFMQGMAAAGYTPVDGFNASNCGPDDVLVVWNRHGPVNQLAMIAEQRGCPVIVAENGYLGDMGEYFALALDHHNGAGRWPVGDKARPLPMDIKPWRTDGEHILVLPQRGIGAPGVAMPRDWTRAISVKLKSATGRKIVVRDHPGNKRNDVSLTEQMEGAWAAVVWGSGAGIKCILAGVPVFYTMPNWIGGPAARFGVDDIEAPFVGDRAEFLRRLSWAQWTLDEVRSGLPFRSLLEMA